MFITQPVNRALAVVCPCFYSLSHAAPKNTQRQATKDKVSHAKPIQNTCMTSQRQICRTRHENIRQHVSNEQRASQILKECARGGTRAHIRHEDPPQNRDHRQSKQHRQNVQTGDSHGLPCCLEPGNTWQHDLLSCSAVKHKLFSAVLIFMKPPPAQDAVAISRTVML